MAARAQEVINAVTKYVYDRHSNLTRTNVIGWTEEDLERAKVDKQGYLVFTVEDVSIEEREETDDPDSPIWYVAATLNFQVNDGGETIDGDVEVYEAYQEDNGVWCIQWDHC